jgi:hypothetical protein
MWSLLTGFVGGVVAWIAMELIGKPLTRFIQLRNEAAEALALYEDRTWMFEDPEIEPPGDDWLQKRRERYEAIGSALIAFERSQRFFSRILHHKALGRFRYYPSSAGLNLKTLGEIRPGSRESYYLLGGVRSGLKFKISPWVCENITS